jgi:hypothetical protein
MEAVEVNAPGCNSVGGVVAINRGVISDCYVTGNIFGNRQVGGLAGFNDTQQTDSETGIIQNCYTTGSVSGSSSVGGLLGDNNDEGAVSNCYSLSEVYGSFCVGGLVGVNEDNSNISDSYASGNVSGYMNVGGLAGSNDNNSNISNSFATGSVSGDYKIGGLVGENTNDSIISNCYASGSIIGNENYIGGLAGENYNSDIYDSYSKGSVHGNDEVGGLVGRMQEVESSISGSYATGNVSGNELIGGLAGYSEGFIRDSYATGEVLGTVYVGGLAGSNGFEGTIYCCCASGVVSGNEYVGALVGWNGDGIIHCSYATGSVSGDSNIGGLAGYNYGTIYHCYAGGKMLDIQGIGGLGTASSVVSMVTGDEKVGGLVGFNCGYISYCYSINKVIGNADVGGFMGENQSGEVTNSLWDVQSSGQNSMCGIQDGYGCHDSYGKTTAQMQTAATYLEEGWDFADETDNGTEDIWKITEGLDYPHLWWEKYGGGTGEPNDPYLIYTAEQLNTIGLNQEDADKHFKLMADIDLSAYKGDSFNRIGFYPTDYDPNRHYSFTGVFDGYNHTISNFTYVVDVNEPPSWGYYGDTDVGLFGVLSGEQAQIKNLGLIDPNIYPAATCSERVSRVGAIAGRLSRGSITNCYVEGGQVSSDCSVGGLVGEVSRGGTISNCYTTCDVILAKERWLRPIEEPWGKMGSSFGGLVGSTRGQIYNCCATGRIEANSIVGGLVGYNGYDEYSDAVIYDSYATGDVSGEESVGGLVGRNDDTIRRCCAFGNVSGLDIVGGLVGLNTRFGKDQYIGIVTNSYAMSSISGNNFVGGMAGVNMGIIKECYSAGEVLGISSVGGLVGTNRYSSKDGTADNSFWDKQTSGQQTSAGGTGLNTEQMQTTNTFLEAGWDFVDETENGAEDIWWIEEGYDYPHLWWELNQ